MRRVYAVHVIHAKAFPRQTEKRIPIRRVGSARRKRVMITVQPRGANPMFARLVMAVREKRCAWVVTKSALWVGIRMPQDSEVIGEKPLMNLVAVVTRARYEAIALAQLGMVAHGHDRRGRWMRLDERR